MRVPSTLIHQFKQLLYPPLPLQREKIIKWQMLDLIHGLEVAKATSKAMWALEKEQAWIQAQIDRNQRMFIPFLDV